MVHLLTEVQFALFCLYKVILEALSSYLPGCNRSSLTLFLLFSSATTAEKWADIFTQLCRTCGRPPSWGAMVSPESISSQMTLHCFPICTVLWFVINSIKLGVLFNSPVCWVSWKPSAFLMYKYLPLEPEILQFHSKCVVLSAWNIVTLLKVCSSCSTALWLI